MECTEIYISYLYVHEDDNIISYTSPTEEAEIKWLKSLFVSLKLLH